jgi:hypothetical protein
MLGAKGRFAFLSGDGMSLQGDGSAGFWLGYKVYKATQITFNLGFMGT